VDRGSSELRGAGREARPGLVIVVTDDRGRPAAGHGVSAWLARVAPKSARGEVAIALVSDAEIRRLNRTYRRKDSATDVLSFPSARTSRSTRRASYLGDIAIATGVARTQAREAGHSYATELKVLALHGLLHLLGYDHHDPRDGGRMARAERRLRINGGLANGLIERTARVGKSEGRGPSANHR